MILTIAHLIIALGLIIIILLQGKGGWLSQKWSSGNFHTKRGAEKILFLLTIIFAILFLVSSIISLIKV